MLSPSGFRELVSGRQRGLGAGLVRCGLRLVEIPYTLAVRWRNRRYDAGARPVYRAPVPVISVGNLTLGGTGKTPLVEWMARWLRERGIRPAILSRGYGARRQGPNDEALELQQDLPDVPHVQNPDRVEGAKQAVEEHHCEALLLDDAFQHRRIHRDLDIVVLDALEPFGYGHVFPRGTLREPVAGLRRADVVILSRADVLRPAQRDAIRREVNRYAPDVVWAEVIHAPQRLASARGEERPLAFLADNPVAAFCGVGNPAGFQHTLEILGYRVITFREFADHYRYKRAALASLIAWANRLDVEAVVCTRKDLVKLGIDRLGCRPLWAVAVAIEFLTGREKLESKLAGLLGR